MRAARDSRKLSLGSNYSKNINFSTQTFSDVVMLPTATDKLSARVIMNNQK